MKVVFYQDILYPSIQCVSIQLKINVIMKAKLGVVFLKIPSFPIVNGLPIRPVWACITPVLAIVFVFPLLITWVETEFQVIN